MSAKMPLRSRYTYKKKKKKQIQWSLGKADRAKQHCWWQHQILIRLDSK